MANTRLTRSETDKMIAGVCGGLSAYLGIDSVLVRLAFVILAFASGVGFPIYLLLWLIMPNEANVDKPGSAVIQENIEEMGAKVSSRVNRLGQPNAVGVILILLGIFFLFNQFGWTSWASGIFWPLVIIAAGVYMLARRSR